MKRSFDKAQGVPGDLLRRLASRVCRASTLERLIDPVIADLQTEHSESVRRGHVWRSRWVLVVGTLAFWKVVGVHAIERVVPIARELAAADDGALRRTFGFSTRGVHCPLRRWCSLCSHPRHRGGCAEAGRRSRSAWLR